jgi:hypothetical protein
MRSKVF